MDDPNHPERRDSASNPLSPELPAEIRQIPFLWDTELLRSVVNLATDLIFVKDKEGKYILFNRAASDLIERPIEEVLGHDDTELFSPESAEFLRRHDQLVMNSGKPLLAEEHLVWQGNEKTFLVSRVPYTDSRGNVIGLMGISRDISARKQAEELTLRNQAYTEAIIQTAAEGICVFEQISPLVQKRFSVWNHRMTELTGYTLEEINDHGWSILTPPENPATHQLPFLDLNPLQEWRGLEGRIRNRAGAILTLSASTSRIRTDDGRITIIALIQDITERKAAEQARLESEQRFRLFMQHLPGRAWIKDEDQRYVYVNPMVEQSFNRRQEEFIGKSAEEIFDHETSQQFRRNDFIVLDSNLPINILESIERPDGSKKWSHVSKFPIPAVGDLPRMLGGIAIDITEARYVEEAYRLSEERLETAQALAHIGSFFWLIDRNQIYWSDELFRIYGYEPHAIEPNLEMYLSHIHAEDRQRIRNLIDVVLREGGQIQDEYRIHTIYNDIRWVAANGCCIRDDSGRVVAIEGTCQDISERKQLEEQLRHSQKMEAIGVLAGGVAHDFNNLLTVISGYTYMLLNHSNLDHPSRESLEFIQDAAQRATSLTRQLLMFGRRQKIEPVITDFNELIANTSNLLARMVGPDIDIKTELSENQEWVKVDPTQIEQVLINLAVNSRDAMKNGGEIRITTASFAPEESPESTVHPQRFRSGYVELCFIDNGEGMSEEVRRRIFEPFFTTRELGKGTGLGLAVVHGIVQQFGGDVQVQSRLGHGTVFRIRLPLTTEHLKSKEPKTSAADRRTILLVDDDSSVRRITRVTLESSGYKVFEAVGGHDALKILDEISEPVHLLITDVSMPQIEGRELAIRALQKRNDLRVLFISGYTNNAALQEGLSVPNDFLEKPFTPQGLISCVEKLIQFEADQRT